MTYWLDVFTPKSWEEFKKAGATVSGFSIRRWKTVQGIRPGDILICYMKGQSCWFAALEVISDAFQDYETRIWSDDIYPARIQVKPLVMVDPKKAIPAKRILPRLKLFANLRDHQGWGVLLRISPRRLAEEDGNLIISELRKLAGGAITTEEMASEKVQQGYHYQVRGMPYESGQIQKRAKEFENYLIGFLKRMDFKDINGRSDFQIGDIQVDACGGHEDTLIVIECRSAGRKSARSIRKDIQEIRGRMHTLTKGMKRMPEYSKYRRLKLVIATKNIAVGEADREFASRDSPKVYIWDEPFIDYYADLAKTIGKYARFSLLSEMDVEPRIKTLARVPALSAKLGKHQVYWFFLEPKKLLEVAYVARREIGNERYYQRILKQDRITNIQKFLRNNHGIFPNNIIVSFTKAPKFVPFQQDWGDWPEWLKFGVITFPETYRACWIIDGQHRLYAFSDPKMTNPPKIAVLAFDQLSQAKQARFFVEINEEQKSVDPDLLWDLEGDMAHESSRGIISRIVKGLAEREPFEGRIYVPLRGKRKRGQLKFSGICTAIKECKLTDRVTKTLEGANKNPLWDKDSGRIIQKVTNALEAYFEIVSDIFTDEQKAAIVFKNTSIVLFINVCEYILATLTHLPTKDECQKYVVAFQKAIQDTYPDSSDLKKLLGRCASKGGRSVVMAELVTKIRVATGDQNFGGKTGGVPQQDERELTEFERSLAKFVISALGVVSWDDLRRVASQDLCTRASSRQATTIDEALTLGECKEIVFRTKNWPIFEDSFLKGPMRFGDKGKVETALDEVMQYRNKTKHGRQSQITFNEPARCRLHMEQFRKCILTQPTASVTNAAT